MPDQKISELTSTTPADGDNLAVERSATSNWKVSMLALRTWLAGFFAPAAHPGDATIHFTEASIDHTAISNIGTNSHAQIDTHIADTTNPHAVTAAQAGADPAGSAAAVQADFDAHDGAGGTTHPAFTSGVAGFAPASGGGTTNFLRADGAWSAPPGGVSDHGALTGLADDDHTQYHNDARGDLRYDSLGSAAAVQTNLDAHEGTGGVAEHPVFTSTVAGFAPASGGGTTNFLRADGTFAAVPGGGGGVSAGTPFVVGDLLAVESAAGDGSIESVGFAASDVARLSQANTFAGTVNTSGAAQVQELGFRVYSPNNEPDHTNLSNIGTNSHAQIDTHIADATLHFTEASIDHTAISNIGTNSHAQIDTHIANTSNPHSVTAAQVGAIATGATATFQAGHTWTLKGILSAADNVMPFVVPEISGQVVTIERVSYKTTSGTANIKVTKNGGDITGLTSLSASATRSTTTKSEALADLDELDLVINSGTPTDLTVTVILQHVVTVS